MNGSQLPRMRTARLLHSLHSVLAIARSQGVSVSIAYVDVDGKTRFLWREHDAAVGSLLVAEAQAWTVIARSMPDKSLTDLLRERVASHELHGFCEGPTQPSLEPVEGGAIITVHNKIVGAVGIAGSGVDDKLRQQLCNAAFIGYTEMVSVNNQHSHFHDTDRGGL